MKAPKAKTEDEAMELGRIIGRVTGNLRLWSISNVYYAWQGQHFNDWVSRDWENVFTEAHCREIVTQWIAHRLS